MNTRVAALALVAVLVGCGRSPEDPTTTVAPGTTTSPVALTDITAAAGVSFVHDNDASVHKRLPETMGSGCAFFDQDGDGRPDLYLVNGTNLATRGDSESHGVFYRNLDGKRFRDVTDEVGLTAPLYGMGTAVGDIDNDGRLDLFVTGVGGDRMYRNGDDGRLEDVTTLAGLDHPAFSSSAAFLDYDRDGWLDLFVGRYVVWRATEDVECRLDGQHPIYCTPERYSGATSRLYRNLGDGRFEDVTEHAGLLGSIGKTLGVAVLDHDRDGWPDLVLANDTTRNFLYVNDRAGRFQEVAIEAQIAFSESGATRGGMGVAAADADGDGRDDVVIANYSMEMAAFFRGTGSGTYLDDAAQFGIGLPTLQMLAFGTLLTDLDNDGWLDVVFANGHIEPEIATLRRNQSYAQPLQIFHNLAGERFEQVSSGPNEALSTPLVGRGLCAADIDGDGDIDLAITQNGGPAVLLRNDTSAGHWIRIKPYGQRSNRAGLGLSVRLHVGSRTIARSLRSGGSYLSASEPVLTIGIGDVDRIQRIEVSWPSGAQQTLMDVPANQTLRIQEPDVEHSNAGSDHR